MAVVEAMEGRTAPFFMPIDCVAITQIKKHPAVRGDNNNLSAVEGDCSGISHTVVEHLVEVLDAALLVRQVKVLVASRS
jgi:hypothetical protein